MPTKVWRAKKRQVFKVMQLFAVLHGVLLRVYGIITHRVPTDLENLVKLENFMKNLKSLEESENIKYESFFFPKRILLIFAHWPGNLELIKIVDRYVYSRGQS